MRLTLQQSWRHSLAAVTLFAMFGNANLPAQAAPMPDELFLNFVPDATVQNGEDEPTKQQLAEHAQAVAEKLRQAEARIRELEEKGDLEGAKKLSAERDEFKRVAEAKARIAKEAIQGAAELRKKIASDSPDELRERMKQLELENAKLREALAEMTRKMGGGDKGREEMERARKELMELHEKLSKEHRESPKEDVERAKALYEKALRDKLDRTRIDQAAAKEKDVITFQEKMKQLAEEKEKLKEKGRSEEAEKVQADMRKLAWAAEKAARAKIDADQKGANSQVEVGAMLKELREEVSRLRNEVSELRQMVREGDAKRGR